MRISNPRFEECKKSIHRLLKGEASVTFIDGKAQKPLGTYSVQPSRIETLHRRFLRLNERPIFLKFLSNVSFIDFNPNKYPFAVCSEPRPACLPSPLTNGVQVVWSRGRSDAHRGLEPYSSEHLCHRDLLVLDHAFSPTLNWLGSQKKYATSHMKIEAMCKEYENCAYQRNA